MNDNGDKGWDISFQLIEKRRLLFLWAREAAIVRFSKQKGN